MESRGQGGLGGRGLDRAGNWGWCRGTRLDLLVKGWASAPLAEGPRAVWTEAERTGDFVWRLGAAD